MPPRPGDNIAARRTARAHVRVAEALRTKRAACVRVAKAMRAVAKAIRSERGHDDARELEATVSLRFARSEEREAATCEQEARTAESRASKAASRARRWR